jgi:hypothetical protein
MDVWMQIQQWLFYENCFPMELQPLLGCRITFNDTCKRSIGIFWTSDQPDAGTSTWPATHTRQSSMPPSGFEPTIPASELMQTHALDSAATESTNKFITFLSFNLNIIYIYIYIYVCVCVFIACKISNLFVTLVNCMYGLASKFSPNHFISETYKTLQSFKLNFLPNDP